MSLIWRHFRAYGKRRWGYAAFCVGISAAFNLYFLFFIQGGRTEYLLYLDVLVLCFFMLWGAVDFWRFAGEKKNLEKLLGQKGLICRIYHDFENQELAEHDVRILEEQLEEHFRENCELQDYVAKWCHEMKLPLSAGLLMGERISDYRLRNDMKEQLERMNQQVGSLLLGCRLQGTLFDLQVRKVSLKECVQMSIHNHQFFLIQKRFEMKVNVGDEMVYTDPAWLVYVLDQLISNAVKYAKTRPILSIWAERERAVIRIFVEDNGQGIQKSELPRVFETGFTGENHHNGKHRSTGMGLYMAEKIMKKMGHEIGVESEYGKYSRFWIVFRENDYFGR